MANIPEEQTIRAFAPNVAGLIGDEEGTPVEHDEVICHEAHCAAKQALLGYPASNMFGRPSVAGNVREIDTEPEAEEGRSGRVASGRDDTSSSFVSRGPQFSRLAHVFVLTSIRTGRSYGRLAGYPAATAAPTTSTEYHRTTMAIDAATKILIILPAGTESHEGRARALHAVLYARELDEAGATVRLVFDGAGSAWLARWRSADGPSSRAGSLFAELAKQGLTYEVCDYRAGAFDVKEDLFEAGEALAGAYMDHPSVAARVAEGFAVWIL